MIAHNPFAERTVLVTGGLGFLGSNLAIRLARRGAQVTIADTLGEQFGGNLANIEPVRDAVTVRTSDLRDPQVVDDLVRDQDYIFHLAGQVSHGDSMRDPKLDWGVNCLATMNLVESCRRHNSNVRTLYTSTRQVYGRPLRLPVDEDHPTAPVDVNGINKLAAEHYHLLYHHTYGLRATVLRLTNTYGPRQHLRTNRQGFTTVFMRQALRGETINLFDGGHQRRDFNYVEDVVDAMMVAIISDCCLGRVFNLGGHETYSLRDFVNALARHCDFDVRSVPFPAERKLIDIGDYRGDFSRFRAATGWQPRVSLGEGLARTVAFYREHRETYWQ
jgi:UDP-glucose 4-epimerase